MLGPLARLTIKHLLGSLDGAEGAELRGDGLGGGVLLLHEALVGLLETLDGGLELLLGVRDLLLEGGDLGVELVGRERLGGLDGSSLLLVAELHVGGGAGRAEVVLGELEEGVEVAAAFVGLTVGVTTGEVLQGGETTDAHLGADGLVVLGGAVDVADDNGVVVGELAVELIPSGSELFAVSAPRSVELDERALTGDGLLEGGTTEGLRGGSGSHEGGGDHALERHCEVGVGGEEGEEGSERVEIEWKNFLPPSFSHRSCTHRRT